MKSTKVRRVRMTDEQLHAASDAARVRERTATKILDARYDREHDAIVATLSTGAALSVPRLVIPGFSNASPAMLDDVAITPGNEGLWSEAVDDGVLLEQLLIFTVGERTLATIGARLNAAKKSPARAAASRANGAKGGRPRKTAA